MRPLKITADNPGAAPATVNEFFWIFSGESNATVSIADGKAIRRVNPLVSPETGLKSPNSVAEGGAGGHGLALSAFSPASARLNQPLRG